MHFRFQIVFFNTEKVKSMKLTKFDPTATPSINRKFEGILIAEVFAKTFAKITHPADGELIMPNPSTRVIDNTTTLNPAKRQKVSSSMEHAMLLPATRRKYVTSKTDEETLESGYNEEEMDEKTESF